MTELPVLEKRVGGAFLKDLKLKIELQIFRTRERTELDDCELVILAGYDGLRQA